MGQNFLTASWVPERIAKESGADKNTGVLEIGPGIGALTRELASLAAKVVAIELDRALEPVLKETLADLPNTELVFADALKTDLAALVKEKLHGLRPIVCANVPYNITSPLLSAFIEAECFSNITVMVQREVARRICAKAGAPDYGAFTVYANWHTEPKILFDVSPGCFIPQPKVASSVIELRPRSGPPAEVRDEKLFFRVVRSAFNQRRKTLVNALSSGMPEFSKEAIAKAIAFCGFDEKIRGEALDIQGFAAITNALYDTER
jgi:16S rRNA (adenine1518-N6/adenine1519-N6)-dimethyltransferase